MAWSDKPINGIPSPSNGEYGYILRNQTADYTIGFYCRPTGKMHVRVLETSSSASKENLIERQIKNGTPKYYAIESLEDGTHDESEALNTIHMLLSL